MKFEIAVCDDRNDNFFINVEGARFPEIIEDEPAQAWLYHEYPAA